MKYLPILLLLFFNIQINGQDSIPNHDYINIVNDYYDLSFENKADETWYLYEFRGGGWKKTIKNNQEVWLPFHRLTKIEVYEEHLTKTFYRSGEIILNQVLDTSNFIRKLDIENLPTYLDNPLIKNGCTSELPILIKSTKDKIVFYQLPVCPVIRIETEDKLRDDFEILKKQAKYYIKVSKFIEQVFY